MCAGCTRMRVVDSTYTCGKCDGRIVNGNNLCDDYDSIYEQMARDIEEKCGLKASSRVSVESPRIEEWSS